MVTSYNIGKKSCGRHKYKSKARGRSRNFKVEGMDLGLDLNRCRCLHLPKVCHWARVSGVVLPQGNIWSWGTFSRDLQFQGLRGRYIHWIQASSILADDNSQGYEKKHHDRFTWGNWNLHISRQNNSVKHSLAHSSLLQIIISGGYAIRCVLPHAQRKTGLEGLAHTPRKTVSLSIFYAVVRWYMQPVCIPRHWD